LVQKTPSNARQKPAFNANTFSPRRNSLLPTLEQARTMAIDPSTGLLYLVTTLQGADLRRPPANGIGTLKMNPINGSFQVLVVGN
jgi:hypothetical protein